MTDIVICATHGRFDLSNKAIELYAERKGIKLKKDTHPAWLNCYRREDGVHFSVNEIRRDDPVLVEVINELGEEESSKWSCRPKIVTIPNGVKWQIEQHDGREWVAEKHRIWT
jgi:hypothetical protein